MTAKVRNLCLIALFSFASPALATHIRSAEINVERVPNSMNEFKITVIAYLNLKSNTRFGNTNVFLDFGDGMRALIPPTVGTPRPDLGPDIGTASFTVNHVYAVPGIYKVTYSERDRSSGVLNITNSADTPFTAYTEINTDPKFGLNRFPKLLFSPIDRTCPGITFFHNPGARDEDGDSLSYELTTPAGNLNNPPQYFSPVDKRFYIDYNTANEEDNGPPSFSINPESGLIVWNAPGFVGEYNIAFKIIEWRKNHVTNQVDKLSTTIRDMQIIIEDCKNGRPTLTIPNDICIVAGTSLQATILGDDPEHDFVKIEPVSEVFDFSSHAATLIPSTPAFVSSPASLDFEWNTMCTHVRDQPYQVVFKISDKPKFGTTLVTFKTWSIRVFAPAPQGFKASLDLLQRKSILEWNVYACQNAQKIQVWRKVGSFSYTTTPCNTGNIQSLGYELIDEVDPSLTKYVDNNSGQGLVAGARYCYRLVAVFNAPAGGKSFISDEVCIGPIKADAPILTNVTVEKTNSKNGEIRVRWRSPFEIDKALFPTPYQYDVYRGEGLMNGLPLLKIADHVTDTTWLDARINTTEKAYAYTIVVYSKPHVINAYIPVDTSATASSVRLEAVPGVKKVSLRWSANVPWSMILEESPWHLIYRGKFNDPTNGLILIDSVNVSENEFVFEDTGLSENELYYYSITTVGSYGNDAIGILKNTSQIASTYTINSLLPCAPRASVVTLDCEDFLNSEETCERFDLTSSVFWQPTQEVGCRLDIKSYNIYGADSNEDEYTLIAEHVDDTLFTEVALSSLARCYRVAAVDASGHVSEWSEPVCNDNCPYYELPNVFTPDGNGYNDLFSAYVKPLVEGDKKYDLVNRCPRFVENVNLKVYNRWGREVYSYSSNNSGSIYINWDGKSNTGVQLDAEVYYYVADVTFHVIDPLKKNKTIKGWVHLIR